MSTAIATPHNKVRYWKCVSMCVIQVNVCVYVYYTSTWMTEYDFRCHTAGATWF